MNAVDTNVLIYACDSRDRERQRRALETVERLADGVMPWQVACEFVSASRKIAVTGFTQRAAWDRLREFAAVLPIALPNPEIFANARKFHLDLGVSFWDSMLYAACLDAGVTRLYSEDVPGSAIPGLEIVNPFA